MTVTKEFHDEWEVDFHAHEEVDERLDTKRGARKASPRQDT